MNSKPISSQQVAFLIFLYLGGSALIFVPGSKAGRDVWISSILAALVGLYVLWATITIQNRFPGSSIIKISEMTLGRTLGKLCSAIFVLSLFFITVLYLYNVCLWIRFIIPSLTSILLNPLIVLVAAYCLYQGINSVARLGELLVWVLLLFAAVSLLIPALSISDASRLTPVLTSWQAVLAGFIPLAIWPYAGVSAFSLLSHLVQDLKNNRPIIYRWFLLGACLLIIKNIVIITGLGSELTASHRFPLYNTLRITQFYSFQHIELFFVILWFISGFMAFLIYYQCLMLGLKELFSLRDHRYLILPAGLCVAVFSWYTYPSDIAFVRLYIASPAPAFIFLPVQLGYITLILAAAKWRHLPGRTEDTSGFDSKKPALT